MANPNPDISGLIPWKKGDPSPNPTGRPTGTRNLSTILRRLLEEEVEDDENVANGVKLKKQFQEVIIRKLLKKAKAGDMRAIEQIFDRIEGKATQPIEIENKDINISTYRVELPEKNDKQKK